MKIASEGQVVTLSGGVSAASWFFACGVGLGFVAAASFIVGLFLSGVDDIYDWGCSVIISGPLVGALVGGFLLGLVGMVLGSVLFLFGVSLSMESPTQVLVAAIIGGAVSSMCYNWLRRL